MRKISVKCQLCFDAEIDVVAEDEEEAIDIVKANFRSYLYSQLLSSQTRF